MRDLGWPAAATAAEADLLVACGAFGPGLAAALDQLWQQLPGPRARVDLESADATTEAALEAGRSQLRGGAAQRRDAGARSADDASPHEYHHGSHPAEHQQGHGDPEPEHGEPAGVEGDEQADEMTMPDDGGEHDDGGHGQHGHGGHDHGMSMPAGLAMADRAPDRDLLKLDRLHVPLGPVLPEWPAGLVLHTALQGDVIQEAAVQVLDVGDHGSAWPSGRGSFWNEPTVERHGVGVRYRRVPLDGEQRLAGQGPAGERSIDGR